MNRIVVIIIVYFFPVFLFAQKDTVQSKVIIELSEEQYSSIRQQVEHEFYEAKKKKDWANFSRYEQENMVVKRSPAIVFIGNSITENWYKKHPSFFDNNNFLGRGISGQTSAEILVRFQADVIQLKPKKVVINMGINDIACNNGYISMANILLNIKSMCELSRYNGIEPILTTTLPSNNVWRTDKNGTVYTPAEDIKHLNEMIKQYACDNDIMFIDYYSKMEKNGGLPKELAEDGTHPTLQGYEIMEKIILNSIK